MVNVLLMKHAQPCCDLSGRDAPDGNLLEPARQRSAELIHAAILWVLGIEEVLPRTKVVRLVFWGGRMETGHLFLGDFIGAWRMLNDRLSFTFRN